MTVSTILRTLITQSLSQEFIGGPTIVLLTLHLQNEVDAKLCKCIVSTLTSAQYQRFQRFFRKVAKTTIFHYCLIKGHNPFSLENIYTKYLTNDS